MPNLSVSDRDPILQRYLHDINTYPLLSKEEIAGLSKIIMKKKNDSEYDKARAKLINHNLRLVVAIAFRYYNLIRNIDHVPLSVMDLIQAGNIGLMRAAELYDGREGNTFATYAYFSITRHMQLYINSSAFIRLPLHHRKYMSDLKKLQNEMENEIDDKVAMEKLKLSAVMYSKIKQDISHHRVEINDWNILMEKVVDERQDVIKQVNKNELYNYFLSKIQQLKPNYQNLIYNRYIAGKLVSEIATENGISNQSVNQTMIKALRVLKLLIAEDENFNKLIKNTKEGNKNEHVKLFDPEKNKKHNRRSYKTATNSPFIRDLLRIPKEKVQGGF